MGRYRPPAPPKSLYITREGFLSLKDEEKAIWIRRREVTAALSAAAAEGDRSENAEYIYRKKELREIDRRVRYLQKRLPVLKVVDQLPSDRQRVYFAAWVTLLPEEGEEVTYRIVGPDEIDADPAHISMDSPLAKALLGKHLDDEVEVVTPRGCIRYEIVGIRYKPDEHGNS
jgi:transcription elongation factor GreB